MRSLRPLAHLILLLLTSALIVASSWQRVAAPVAHASARLPGATPAQVNYTPLPDLGESEPNDSLTPTDQADRIDPADGPGRPLDWSRIISGTIAAAGDIDYFSFEVPPASTVAISLTNLAADFDLVLASGVDDTEGGARGIENILDTGGSIQAIGGSIQAIGGSIQAIGGSIQAIGGSIQAISAGAGTTSESLQIFLWQPGIYYIAVAGSGGAASSQPYSLQVRLDGGSLTIPLPEPQVRFGTVPDGQLVDTLFLVNELWMKNRYPGAETVVDQVITATRQLAAASNGSIAIVDISDLTRIAGTETVADIFQGWFANADNPLAANRVARFIDNIIEAATRRNPSGPNAAFEVNLLPAVAQTQTWVVTPQQAVPPPPFPNLRNIVLVGGDNIFPFFRLPDLTTIANESDYASYLNQVDASGIIDANSIGGAALRYRTMLSDNPYGAGRPYRFLGYPLFIPRIAVGRLVESPQDIYAYLAPYVPGAICIPGPCLLPEIDLTSPTRVDRAGFVSGYDFLIDSADEIAQRMGTMGLSRVVPLINNDWNAADLRNAWFDGKYDLLTTRATYTVSGSFGLNSLNAHFDHWQIIPADVSGGFLEAQEVYTPQIESGLNRTPFFSGELVYSVGCHSGYNVIDRNIVNNIANSTLYQADFPQAVLKQGGTYVGNTGYGYGSLDSIDYSERLAALFTRELQREVLEGPVGNQRYVGQQVGRALLNAKQRYLRNATSLSIYDAKVLQVMTLYGLPFMRVQVPNPIPPPPEERPDAPAQRLVPPVPVGSLGSLERVLTFTLQIENQAVTRRDGSNIGAIPALQSIAVDDSFILPTSGITPTARIFQSNQIGRPALPQFAYDITALSSISTTEQLTVRDVTFLGGIYGAEAGYNPVITQVVTETDSILSRTTIEPSFTAGANIWHPDRFYGYSSVGEGEDNRDQLVVTAAQFRADAAGNSGLMRPYRQMSFLVRYIDSQAADADTALNDTTAPIIESVTLFPARSQVALQQNTATATEVVVRVREDGEGETGVEQVEAVYVNVVGNEERWERVVFREDRFTIGQTQRWTATIPRAPGQVRVIVTASDRAGNATTFTSKGSFAPPIGRNLFAPMIWR